MSGISLFKSQEDFYRRNNATMRTARKLTEEAEKGSVDLRYAYKLLPPGSRNFYAKAWEQCWGNDALMYRAKHVDSKRPTIEKFTMDQPETGSLPTNAPKNGLGSEGLICDTMDATSPDYLRLELFKNILKKPNDEDDVADAEDDEEEDLFEAHNVAIADGDAATGEAAWGPAPGDNASALSGGRHGRSTVIRNTPAAARSPSVYTGGSAESNTEGVNVGGQSAFRKSPATSVGSRSSASSGESDEGGPGAPPAATTRRASEPRASAAASASASAKGGGAGPGGAKAVNAPKKSAYPAANALVNKVRAAGDSPSDARKAELKAEYKAMTVRERNRFDKWTREMENS